MSSCTIFFTCASVADTPRFWSSMKAWRTEMPDSRSSTSGLLKMVMIWRTRSLLPPAPPAAPAPLAWMGWPPGAGLNALNIGAAAPGAACESAPAVAAPARSIGLAEPLVTCRWVRMTSRSWCVISLWSSTVRMVKTERLRRPENTRTWPKTLTYMPCSKPWVGAPWSSHHEALKDPVLSSIWYCVLDSLALMETMRATRMTFWMGRPSSRKVPSGVSSAALSWRMVTGVMLSTLGRALPPPPPPWLEPMSAMKPPPPPPSSPPPNPL
mmetsp:Transcript_1718/g.4330  ORF Transcript_1718/g.4330 Transcript_1718/m.4330 type:complete len:268 (+) Transcript_1718:140-943(+)